MRRRLLPSLLTVAMAAVTFRTVQEFGPQPVTFFSDWDHPWVFYVPWLATLPLIGASGVLASRFADGTPADQWRSGLAFTLTFAALWVFFAGADFVVDVLTGRHNMLHWLHGVVWFAVCWLLVPAAMLTIGVGVARRAMRPQVGL